MYWFDCFGAQIFDGDDILIAVKSPYEDSMSLHSAVVISQEDNVISISYNGWNDDKEYTEEIEIHGQEAENHLPLVYKLGTLYGNGEE